MNKKKTVAFQGDHGSFSEEAIYELLGKSISTLACDNFDTLFEVVKKKKADYGILPVENSLIGSVQDNNIRLLENNLHIIGEINLRIIHCLIGHKSAGIKKIRKVYSHPVALDQCRDFLKNNPQMEQIAYYDTAGAVKMLLESGETDSAAIASPFAAQLYKMKVIRKSVEDRKFNFTRFVLLGRTSQKCKGAPKTSIAFSLRNKPGALFKALSVFALRDIDLTRIESHPSRKQAWQYYFFVDFMGSANDETVKNALRHLEEIAYFVKILGCYPAWTR